MEGGVERERKGRKDGRGREVRGSLER